MKNYQFSVLIERDEDGMLVARVPDLPGCHTQAKTMPQLLKRAEEAICLYLQAHKEEKDAVRQDTFVGLQQVNISL